jgi:hypothetical protein
MLDTRATPSSSPLATSDTCSLPGAIAALAMLLVRFLDPEAQSNVRSEHLTSKEGHLNLNLALDCQTEFHQTLLQQRPHLSGTKADNSLSITSSITRAEAHGPKVAG